MNVYPIVLQRVLLCFALAKLISGLPVRCQTASEQDIHPLGTGGVRILWPPGPNFQVLEETWALDPLTLWHEVSEPPSVLGPYYQAQLDATNSGAFYRLASRGTPGFATPPDPTDHAPALESGTYSDHANSTAFLYTGPSAVQVGVAPGAISPLQASVLRGRLKRRDNSPLPGVRVAILNHSQTSESRGYFEVNNGEFNSLKMSDFSVARACKARLNPMGNLAVCFKHSRSFSIPSPSVDPDGISVSCPADTGASVLWH